MTVIKKKAILRCNCFRARLHEPKQRTKKQVILHVYITCTSDLCLKNLIFFQNTATMSTPPSSPTPPQTPSSPIVSSPLQNPSPPQTLSSSPILISSPLLNPWEDSPIYIVSSPNPDPLQNPWESPAEYSYFDYGWSSSISSQSSSSSSSLFTPSPFHGMEPSDSQWDADIDSSGSSDR